jgi:hypothetical protein
MSTDRENDRTRAIEDAGSGAAGQGTANEGTTRAAETAEVAGHRAETAENARNERIVPATNEAEVAGHVLRTEVDETAREIPLEERPI